MAKAKRGRDSGARAAPLTTKELDVRMQELRLLRRLVVVKERIVKLMRRGRP